MKIRCPLVALALIAAAHAEEKITDFTLSKDKHKLRTPAITEASGLAISSADPGSMWIVNDSGGTPDVHLTSTDGTYRGKVTLKDTKNIDWEDLASFTLDGKSYLLVADTGDNSSKRDSCIIYVLREPAIPEAGKNLDSTVVPVWQIRFRYEDGPRDCESVAVDTKAGKIILISKRTNPPMVYELPLHPPEKAEFLTARKIGQTSVKCPTLTLIPFHDQPTGLDITTDNSLAAVITYYGVFLFPRQPKESWADAFSHTPTVLPPHSLGQAESIAFSKDGRTLFAVAEGKESPIRRYLKQENAKP